jgi:hypothetical protein
VTIAGFFARSSESAGLLAAITSFVLVFAPRVQRAWEERIAQEATATCQGLGGTALVGEDRVVSCLPGPPQKGRSP